MLLYRLSLGSKKLIYDTAEFRDYVAITKTFALAAASAFSSIVATTNSGTPFRFVYVAGGDTTTTPGRLKSFQARIKGETELSLADMFKLNPAIKGYSVRPFAVDMDAQDEIKPYIGPRPLIHRAAGVLLGPVIRAYAKDYWAPTGPLGEFLTELALGQHDISQDGAKLEVEVINGFAIWSNAAVRKVKGY